jgi:hypothetical protein
MTADLKRFCVLLRKTEEDEYLDTSGLSPYLMQNLFHPYMEGRDIPLNSLDYDAFDLGDLDRLHEYLGDLETVYGALHGKTENLRKSPPAARPQRAFC